MVKAQNLLSFWKEKNLLVFLLCSFSIRCQSQSLNEIHNEIAAKEINYINNVSAATLEKVIDYNMRTDFCPLHQKVERREIPRENALQGINITVALYKEIDENNPSLSVQILNEVSRRAGFTYTAYATGGPASNESWSDVLLRDVRDYDLAASWYDRTIERLSMGIIFPESWYNSDTIMVMKQASEDDAFVFWSFMLPFSPGLWILIVITIFITGLLYYLFDFVHAQADKEKMSVTIGSSIFTSFYSYTGSRNLFKPKSRASRILTISMAFLYLILISAYTANLTNYYIIKSTPAIEINNINDVISNNLLLCVQRGVASLETLKSQYSKVRILEVETTQELFVYVSEQKCDVALVSMESYETYKHDDSYNLNCDLEWIGRRVFVAGAGFALGDSEYLCSSLLDNVLDFHFVQMKNEGVVDKILKSYRETQTARTCEQKIKSDEGTDTSVTVLNMGGAFAFHLCLIVFSILLGLYDHYRQPKEIKKHVSRELRSSVRKSTLKYFSSFSEDTQSNKDPSGKEDKTMASTEAFDDSHASNLQSEQLFLKLLETMTEQKKELINNIESRRKAQEKLQDELKEIKAHIKYVQNS